jgi:hypothetical protein
MSRAERNSGRSLAAAEAKRQRSAVGSAKPRFEKSGYLAAFIIGAGAATAGFLTLGRSQPAPEATTRPAAQKLPTSYYELLAMTPEELGKVDIAVMNLLCAKGLPAAENLDVPAALAKLDEWAKKVRFDTERHLYRVNDPRYAEHYKHSEARLRCEFIVQCLQEDCGVRYNPDRIYNPDTRDSRDTFIHGMLPGANGGTCASMPVMYVAIGRRLGYPMKLVSAKAHLFCRWDDDKERLNVEGAGNGGVNYDPDEHYRTWPKPISDAEMASGVFLTSMTPQQELAVFLELRAACCRDNRRLVEARAAFAEAHRLEPRDANTFAGLAIVCGADRRPVSTEANPAAEAWLRGPMPADPDDPTPKITMPGVTPTYGIPKKPLDGIRQEVRR